MNSVKTHKNDVVVSQQNSTLLKGVGHYSDYLKAKWDIHSNTKGHSEKRITDPIEDFSRVSRLDNIRIHNFTVGTKVYEIPYKLSKLVKEVEESIFIYSLPEGWDENNARQIEKNLWISSIQFLLEYALYIHNNFEHVLETPEINPVPNGTIDLSWRTKNARMLINIREEQGELLAFYYGDLYKDRFPNKGCVSANNVTSHLLQWIKDYLSE